MGQGGITTPPDKGPRQFRRDGKLTGVQRLGQGGFFEPELDDQNKLGGGKGAKGKRGRTYEMPIRPRVRAVLVERDNEEELMEFHYDPTTFTISRKPRWTEDAPVGGVSTSNYTGSGLTTVKFESLFNDIAPHNFWGGRSQSGFRLSNERNTEQSIQWMMDRTRNRRREQPPQNKAASKVWAPWLNLRDPSAPDPPPVLVFFGVSSPFVCVIDDLQVKTIFQTLGFRGAEPGDPDFASAFSGAAEFNRGGGSQITRATVSITLKEYVDAPE